MRIEAPSLPFHVARAYGVSPTTPATRVQPIQPIQPRSQETRGVEQTGIDRLIGGVVPGGITFDEQGAAAVRDAPLAMYNRPGAKNEAATGVAAGRMLDISG